MEDILEKKKVVFIASEFATGMIPFASTIINTLSQDERFEVHSICVNSVKHNYRGLVGKEANPVFVDYPNNKIIKLLYKVWPYKVVRVIEQVCQKYNPDVVHFLTGDFTLATYVKLNRNKKFYYTVHDLHPHEVKASSIFEKILFKIIAFGYKICRESIDNLTTSSFTQLDELRVLYRDKKCKYTPFPTLVTPSMIKGNHVPPELMDMSDYILFFGSVNSYKGVDLLISAFENSNLLGKTKLVIAGKGLDYSFNSDDIIRLNRFISDEEVASLFRHARLIVYPYISATMSGVLSVAYYFRKFVLASDVPFFKENSTENIAFFKAGDVNDLRVQMEKIYKENNSTNMVSYDKLYSSKTLADSYWELYKD